MEISLPTLYAYVSRGLIRSEAGTGKSRARRYWRADVDALLARKALRQNPAQAAEAALHYGSPVLASAVTLIEDCRFLFYRGHDAVQLAQTTAFESVASLLWCDSLAAEELFPRSCRSVCSSAWLKCSLFCHPCRLLQCFQVLLPLLAALFGGVRFGETAVAQTGALLCTAHLGGDGAAAASWPGRRLAGVDAAKSGGALAGAKYGAYPVRRP